MTEKKPKNTPTPCPTCQGKKMIEGEDWRQLVPAAVAEVIDEIGGVTRIRNVSMQDME